MEFLRIRRQIVPPRRAGAGAFPSGHDAGAVDQSLVVGARSSFRPRASIPEISLAFFLILDVLAATPLGHSPSLQSEVPVPEGQRLAISFDDGPTPELTDRILDELARSGRKDLFFVLVAKARLAPQLIERMVREGHFVGLHGEDHHLPFFRSARYLTHRLSRARADLEKIAGRPIALYDQPWVEECMAGDRR